jgi:salicylate hydroxylase
VTPNATRLFKRWGVYDALVGAATSPTSLTVRRYDGTRTLAHEPDLQGQVQSRYGSPFWGMHRVDLQKAMLDRCNELGVTVRLAARVGSVDFDAPSVTLGDGTTVLECDAVVCADGLWSATRPQFVGRRSPAVLTGDLAYRIVLNLSDIAGPHAEELRSFIRGSTVNFWVGPKSHVVSYTMRAGEVLNIVLLTPDNLPATVVKAEGDLEEMRTLFEQWDPLLRKLLGQVSAVHKWRLMWLEALDEWATPRGTFFMIGDACHPMLPYLAQGANSSLEDGAVLGYLLGKVKRPTKEEQLPRVAEAFQALRKERGRKIQAETFRQRDDFHMEDGPAQRARDEKMLAVLGKELVGAFPSRWTCPVVQPFLYGYDAYGEVEKAYLASPF